jgi:uncharacterized protein YdeI (BOF family)
MHIRYLITLAGTVMLSSTAFASDRMNGGFERAQAGSNANIGASGANTSTNAQRNGIRAGQSSTGVGTGAQMQEGQSITGAGGQNAASRATSGNTNTAEMATVDSLPDSGRVTLRGIVQDVDGDDEFTLSDSTGSIEVELSSSMDLEQGQTVTVVGDVGRSWGKRQLENAMVSNSAAAPETTD